MCTEGKVIHGIFNEHFYLLQCGYAYFIIIKEVILEGEVVNQVLHSSNNVQELSQTVVDVNN